MISSVCFGWVAANRRRRLRLRLSELIRGLKWFGWDTHTHTLLYASLILRLALSACSSTLRSSWSTALLPGRSQTCEHQMVLFVRVISQVMQDTLKAVCWFFFGLFIALFFSTHLTFCVCLFFCRFPGSQQVEEAAGIQPTWTSY